MTTTTRGPGDLKIVPRFAWKMLGLGVLLFGGLLAGSLLVNDPSKFTFFGPVQQVIDVLFLAVAFLICVRPPGVILRENEMIVRQFLRNRHVERRNVREVLFENPGRVIGGDNPRSKNRLIEIVIWDKGKEYVIPLVWCQRLMGLMTPQEAQHAKATLDGWTGRTETN